MAALFGRKISSVRNILLFNSSALCDNYLGTVQKFAFIGKAVSWSTLRAKGTGRRNPHTAEHAGALCINVKRGCGSRLSVPEGVCMITYDEFEQLVREELEQLPPYTREELNGGVLVDPSAYLHPGRVADDLYILGTYAQSGVMGKQIVLYYGSFVQTMGGADYAQLRMQVRETLRHEFLHHLETRAGLFREGTLIEEDRDRMLRYYLRHGLGKR